MPGGDGRLSHELDPYRPGPQDACGVFGVWSPGEEVAKLVYFGLYALQHRGQEAAGIAVSDGMATALAMALAPAMAARCSPWLLAGRDPMAGLGSMPPRAARRWSTSPLSPPPQGAHAGVLQSAA